MPNNTDSYKKIGVQPIAGALGAEVTGVNLRHFDDATFAEVRRAFADNVVLVFRDQNLSGVEMETFARRLGDLSIVAYINPIEGATYTARLLRLAEAKSGARNYGDRWHNDQSIRLVPPKAFLLQNVDCPPYGGGTMFSSLYKAYDGLSDGMKKLCESLIVVHSGSGVFGKTAKGGAGAKKPIQAEGSVTSFRFDDLDFEKYMSAEVEHPLVVVHPETGRKFLYVTGDYCVRFKDMTEIESKPLLDYLHAQAARPEYTCRVRWSPGALVLADNLCAQHFAVNDYAGYRREMYRLEIAGDAPPVGPAMPVRDPVRAAAE